MTTQEQLLAVTPLDGRYANRVKPLTEIVSEYGLMKYRAAVEVGWLATLGSGILPNVQQAPPEAMDDLRTLASGFNMDDAFAIKTHEEKTNHDVKSVELWLRDQIAGRDYWKDLQELVHFGCTSEDITNLAYAMMLRDARKLLVGNMVDIAVDLQGKAHEYAEVPMLARTHGQPATPTTLGKEMAVFSDRTFDSAHHLAALAIRGKFNGASGNMNAVTVAYPEVDWPQVNERFVKSLGIEYSDITTQIDPHDWEARIFNELALCNTVMTDVARDVWQYISLKYFKLAVVKGEVGSSTMPHKVNPIDFENAEGNFGIANAVLNHLSAKLPISRLQRDLSDSTAQRAIGEAVGHTYLGQKSLAKGLGKITANPEAIQGDLEDEWSVLTEAVQTVMRRHGVSGAYEAIKAVSRGKSITKEGYQELVEQLDLPEDAKQTLRELTPSTYIGYAPEIAKSRQFSGYGVDFEDFNVINGYNVVNPVKK
jgi:adenylosuccinate lyase